MPRKKVLVTGLFAQAGMFAVRRFGELGLEVTAAAHHRLAPGLYSKFTARRSFVPRMSVHPDGFVEAVMAELERGYDYYFPGYEEVLLMGAHRRRIESLTRSVLPDPELAMALHDKSRLAQSVAAAGIRVPETFAPASLDEAEAIIEKIDFPVCVKMRISANSIGLRHVCEPKRLRAAYHDVIRRNSLGVGSLPLIQRMVRGREVTVTTLCQEGEAVAQVAYEAIRTLPRAGGTSVCRQTILDGIASPEAVKIARHTHWSGYLGTDFLIDEHSGEVFLIDCNTRPTTALNLAWHAGVDTLSEWMKIADGEPASPHPPCRAGVVTGTFFADFLWYLQTWYQGPESWRERARLRKQWWLGRDRIRWDYHRDDDPWPGRVLWLFLGAQLAQLPFRRIEPAGAFLEHN